MHRNLVIVALASKIARITGKYSLIQQGATGGYRADTVNDPSLG